MVKITGISDYIKENNVESGIIINILVSFILYLSTWYIYRVTLLLGDIQLLIGVIIGVIFSLKNKKSGQSILKYGVITGILGGIFASIFCSIFDWVLYSLVFGFNILSLLLLILIWLLSGIAIGLLGGAVISAYYMYKEVKGERIREETGLDEDFFKDLIEDE